jgi:hypothetical protein
MNFKILLTVLVISALVLTRAVSSTDVSVAGSAYNCDAGGVGTWCSVPATCTAWTITYALPACVGCFVDSVTHSGGPGQAWIHTDVTGYNRYWSPGVYTNNFYTRNFTAGAAECDLGGGSTFDRDWPYTYSGNIAGTNAIAPSDWGANKAISYSCLTNSTNCGLVGGAQPPGGFGVTIYYHVGETVVTLNSPLDTNRSTNQNNTFNFSFDSQGYNVTNCTLFTNQSGSWTASQDNQSGLLNGTVYSNYISYNFTKDGDFLWGVVCTDAAHSSTFYSLNRTLTIDSTPPHDFSFITPTEADGAIINYSWVYVNASVNDSHLDSCWANFSNGTSANYSLGVGASLSFVHYIYTNFTNQPTGINITYVVYCNDSFANVGLTPTHSISIGYLNISLNSPTDVSKTANQNNTFNFTPNTAFNAIVNCSLFSNSSGVWADSRDNQTTVVNATPNYISYNFTKDGDFLWGVRCYNNASVAFWSANRSLTVDSTPPTNYTYVSPTQPDGQIISWNWSYVNVTVNDSHIDQCGLNYSNGTLGLKNMVIYPLTAGVSYVLYNLTSQNDGANISYFVTCNDTFGNVASSQNRSVVVNILAPNVVLVSPFGTTTDTTINFTFTPTTGGTLANATIYHSCNGSAWGIKGFNQTTLVNGSANKILVSDLVVTPACLWNVFVCDTLGRCSFQSTDFVLTIASPSIPPSGGGGGGSTVVGSISVTPQSFSLTNVSAGELQTLTIQISDLSGSDQLIQLSTTDNYIYLTDSRFTLKANQRVNYSFSVRAPYVLGQYDGTVDVSVDGSSVVVIPIVVIPTSQVWWVFFFGDLGSLFVLLGKPYMGVPVSVLILALSVAFAIYFGLKTIKRPSNSNVVGFLVSALLSIVVYLMYSVPIDTLVNGFINVG